MPPKRLTRANSQTQENKEEVKPDQRDTKKKTVTKKQTEKKTNVQAGRRGRKAAQPEQPEPELEHEQKDIVDDQPKEENVVQLSDDDNDVESAEIATSNNINISSSEQAAQAQVTEQSLDHPFQSSHTRTLPSDSFATISPQFPRSYVIDTKNMPKVLPLGNLGKTPCDDGILNLRSETFLKRIHNSKVISTDRQSDNYDRELELDDERKYSLTSDNMFMAIHDTFKDKAEEFHWLMTLYSFYLEMQKLTTTTTDTKKREIYASVEAEIKTVLRISVATVFIFYNGRNVYDSAAMSQILYFHLCGSVNLNNAQLQAIVENMLNASLDSESVVTSRIRFQSVEETLFPTNFNIMCNIYTATNKGNYTPYYDKNKGEVDRNITVIESILKEYLLSSYFTDNANMKDKYNDLFGSKQTGTNESAWNVLISPKTVAYIYRVVMISRPPRTFVKKWLKIQRLADSTAETTRLVASNATKISAYNVFKKIIDTLDPLKQYFLLHEKDDSRNKEQEKRFVDMWNSLHYNKYIKFELVPDFVKDSKIDSMAYDPDISRLNSNTGLLIPLSTLMRLSLIEAKVLSTTDSSRHMLNDCSLFIQHGKERYYYQNEYYQVFLGDVDVSKVSNLFEKDLYLSLRAIYTKKSCSLPNVFENEQIHDIKNVFFFDRRNKLEDYQLRLKLQDMSKKKILYRLESEQINLDHTSKDLGLQTAMERASIFFGNLAWLTKEKADFFEPPEQCPQNVNMLLYGGIYFMHIFCEKYSQYTYESFLSYLNYSVNKGNKKIGNVQNVDQANVTQFQSLVKSVFFDIIHAQSFKHRHRQYISHMSDPNNDKSLVGFEDVVQFDATDTILNTNNGWLTNVDKLDQLRHLHKCYICENDQRIRDWHDSCLDTNNLNQIVQVVERLNCADKLIVCSKYKEFHSFFENQQPSVAAHVKCLLTIQVYNNLTSYENIEETANNMTSRDYVCLECANQHSGSCVACDGEVEENELETHTSLCESLFSDKSVAVYMSKLPQAIQSKISIIHKEHKGKTNKGAEYTNKIITTIEDFLMDQSNQTKPTKTQHDDIKELVVSMERDYSEGNIKDAIQAVFANYDAGNNMGVDSQQRFMLVLLNGPYQIDAQFRVTHIKYASDNNFNARLTRLLQTYAQMFSINFHYEHLTTDTFATTNSEFFLQFNKFREENTSLCNLAFTFRIPTRDQKSTRAVNRSSHAISTSLQKTNNSEQLISEETHNLYTDTVDDSKEEDDNNNSGEELSEYDDDDDDHLTEAINDSLKYNNSQNKKQKLENKILKEITTSEKKAVSIYNSIKSSTRTDGVFEDEFATKEFRWLAFLYCYLKYKKDKKEKKEKDEEGEEEEEEDNIEDESDMFNIICCNSVNCSKLYSNEFSFRTQPPKKEAKDSKLPDMTEHNYTRYFHRCCSEAYFFREAFQISRITKKRNSNRSGKKEYNSDDDSDYELDESDSEGDDEDEDENDENSELAPLVEEDEDDNGVDPRYKINKDNILSDGKSSRYILRRDVTSSQSDTNNKKRKKEDPDQKKTKVTGEEEYLKAFPLHRNVFFKSDFVPDEKDPGFYCPSCRAGANIPRQQKFNTKNRKINFRSAVFISVDYATTNNDYEEKYHEEEKEVYKRFFPENIYEAVKLDNSDKFATLMKERYYIDPKEVNEEYSAVTNSGLTWENCQNDRVMRIAIPIYHPTDIKERLKIANSFFMIESDDDDLPKNETSVIGRFCAQIKRLFNRDILNTLELFTSIQIEIPRVIVFNPKTKKIWDSAVFVSSIISKDNFDADSNFTHVWNAALYKGNQYAGRTSMEGLSTGIHRTPYIHSSIYPVIQNTRISTNEYEQQLMVTNIDSKNTTELYNSYYGCTVFHFIVVHRTPIGNTALTSKSMIKKKQGMIDKTILIPKRGYSPPFEHYELICDIHTSVNIMSFRISTFPYKRHMNTQFPRYRDLEKPHTIQYLSKEENEFLLTTIDNNILFINAYNTYLDYDFTIKDQILLNQYVKDIPIGTKEVKSHNKEVMKEQTTTQKKLLSSIVQRPVYRVVLNNTSLESENKLRRIFIDKTRQSLVLLSQQLDQREANNAEDMEL